MKKIISMLVVLAMILSMVPAVFAEDTGVVITSGTDVAATVAEPVTYTWTASANGTLTVAMGAASPGWKYTVFDAAGNTVGLPQSGRTEKSADFTLTGGTEYTFKAVGFNSSTWDEVAANLTYTLTFVADEEQGGGEVVKSEYEVSETALAVGDNTLTLLDTAVTTIYVFEPSETAVYSFTAPEGAIVGYWGAGSWFLSDPGSTSNTCEWTCTGVGQSAYIGVSGVEGAFTLNVAKTGDYTVVEIPIVAYENKATLNAFTVPEGAVLGQYVDVYSETTHTAVYSETDGYYHLDSVDGDVLLVDMNYNDIVLSDALKSDRPVMYAYTTDENGDDVKYDIGAAIQEYEAVMDENGYYPVTEDVLLFYQVYAVGAGTFTFHLSGDYNEDCVWMYCMRTMNMDNVVIEPTDPSEPEETDPTEPSEPEETDPTDSSEPEETDPSETEPSEPVDGEIVLNESVSGSSSTKYTYSYTPASDGVLSITVGDGSATWNSDVVYFANMINLTTVGSASGTAAGTYTVDVTGGTAYTIRVWTSGGAATPVTVVFQSAGGEESTESSEPEEVEKNVYEVSTTVLAVGDNSLTMLDTAVTTIFKFKPTETGTYTFTAPEGAVAGNWGSNAYYLVDPANTTNTCAWTCTGVGQSVYIGVSGVEGDFVLSVVKEAEETEPTDPSESDPTDPSESEPTDTSEPEEVEKNVYEVSATELAVGDNSLTMLDTAVTTIFKFKPTETGTYTFTAPEGAVAGNWGSNVSYLNDPANTTNTCAWTCTGVGQSVYIGVSGIEGDFTLTVVKEAEETEPTDPSESEPTDPSETEPSEPETEPTIPSVPDEDAPADAVFAVYAADGTATYYTTGSQIVTVITAMTSGTLKLYQDIALGSNKSLDVSASANIVFDLNGCTVSNSYANVGCLYMNGGTVTLIDSSAEGDGLIQNTNSSGYGIEIWNGTVYMQSGNVDATSNAVRLYNAGDSFYMQGGTLTAQRYAINAQSGSTVSVSGGTLQVTMSTQYAIYAASNTTAAISGGNFVGLVSGAGLAGKISGGYFTVKVTSSYIASGCELQDNDDAVYLYKVVDPSALEPEPEPVYVAAVYANGQLVASYETVAAAIAAAEGGYVKLLMDVSEDITVSADLYLDLNGCTVSGAVTVAEGATLYGMDSTTDDYDCADGYGKLTGTVTGNVATNFKSDVTGAIKRYMTIVEESGCSFHRFYLGITHMSLKPGTTGVGYKAIFAGDEMVQANVEAYGFKLQLQSEPVINATKSGSFVSGKAVTLRLDNYDVVNHGTTGLSASVTLTLKDGSVIESASVTKTMKEMVEAVNDNFDNYNAAQQAAITALVEKYYDTMQSWNVAKIYTPATEEESAESTESGEA